MSGATKPQPRFIIVYSDDSMNVLPLRCSRADAIAECDGDNAYETRQRHMAYVVLADIAVIEEVYTPTAPGPRSRR